MSAVSSVKGCFPTHFSQSVPSRLLQGTPCSHHLQVLSLLHRLRGADTFSLLSVLLEHTLLPEPLPASIMWGRGVKQDGAPHHETHASVVHLQGEGKEEHGVEVSRCVLLALHTASLPQAPCRLLSPPSPAFALGASPSGVPVLLFFWFKTQLRAWVPGSLP